MKAKSIVSCRSTWLVGSRLLVSALSVTCVLGLATSSAMAGQVIADPRWKYAEDFSSAKDWNIKAENISPTGHNPLYFPLKPGHKFIMERPDHPDGYFRKEVIILDETEKFDVPGIGKFESAVVQEDEFYDGRWTQRAKNWFAYDKATGSMLAFGEISWEIDHDGNKVFEGTWRVGEPDGNGMAEPGLLMPSTFNLGARYIFDGSESEAFGGSENIETGRSMTTPAGKFENCVRVREQGLTNLHDITDKIWCPGVGLIYDSSDGKLIASDSLPNTDTSSFGLLMAKQGDFKAPVAKISGEEAAVIAVKTVPGQAKAVSIERKRGHNVYVVEVMAEKDGIETDVFVDIETGEVVGTDR